MKCYSWSRYWSNGQDYHVFENPNHSGYTHDLEKAGVYDVDGNEKILKTKADIRAAKQETHNECYYIPVDKVDLLGNIHKTVRN